VEGQIHRLKLLKRQMYRRAKLDSFALASSKLSELHRMCGPYRFAAAQACSLRAQLR